MSDKYYVFSSEGFNPLEQMTLPSTLDDAELCHKFLSETNPDSYYVIMKEVKKDGI